MAEWIRTEDRMPPVAEPVLIARRAEYGRPLIVEQGILLPGGVWKTFGHKFRHIPFWMPLPAPPEEAIRSGPVVVLDSENHAALHAGRDYETKEVVYYDRN